jgi:sterol 3beta-glucosyltransferase
MSASRITILTAGSRGDVQPYVALGLGLQAAGYQVRIASFSPFEEFVSAFGLEFVEISNPLQELSETEEWNIWQASGRNTLRYVRYLKRFVRATRAALEQMLDDMWRACQDADGIISSSSGFGAPHIADKLKRPLCWGLCSPMSITATFPHYSSPVSFSLGPYLNRLTYTVADRVYGHIFGPSLNRWRQQRLNLPRVHPSGAYGLFARRQDPVLYAYSTSIIPKPNDWGDHQYVTGYWFLDRAQDWRPPPALVTFLAAGPPPIYLGLAGVNGVQPGKLVEMALKALAQTRQRGLLLLDGVDELALPEWALKIEPTPHDWLFPQVAVVVHHGGAGTTGAALRAGVPAIVIPGFFDQPFWAQRVADLGVGGHPIAPRHLSAKRLAAAIKAATCDETMHARAYALGNKIRAESGVNVAVELVNHYFSIG